MSSSMKQSLLMKKTALTVSLHRAAIMATAGTAPTTPAKPVIPRVVATSTPDSKPPTPILSRTSSYADSSRSPSRVRSPAIRFPKLHDESDDDDRSGAATPTRRTASAANQHPVVAPVFFINPNVRRRGRSSTVGSVASFVQRRPASAVSILLGILLAIALILAVIGLIMLIFVVNSGGLLGGNGRYAVEGRSAQIRDWALKREPASPVFRHLHALFASSTAPATTLLSSPASGLVGGATPAAGESTVFVVKTSRIHASRPASFGPHITEHEGRAGWLAPIEVVLLGNASLSVESDRADLERARRGCPPADDDPAVGHHRPALEPPATGWVAVMERGSCPFATKIRYAQSLGAAAVIVGDWADVASVATESSPSLPTSFFAESWNWDLDPSDVDSVSDLDDGSDDEGALAGFGSGLITMYAPGDTSDIHIPSVFVARESYLSLRKDWDEAGTVPSAPSPADPVDGLKKKKLEKVKALQIVMSRDEIWSWCAPILASGRATVLMTMSMQAIPRHPDRPSLPPIHLDLLHPPPPPDRRLPPSEGRPRAERMRRQPPVGRVEPRYGKGSAGHGPHRRPNRRSWRQGGRTTERSCAFVDCRSG